MSFCQTSGLKLLYMSIEGDSGYIFALNDSGVILNKPVTLRWNWNWCPLLSTLSQRVASLFCDERSSLCAAKHKGTLTIDEPTVWPSSMSVDYKEGRLMFTQDDVVYAILHKNPDY